MTLARPAGITRRQLLGTMAAVPLLAACGTTAAQPEKVGHAALTLASWVDWIGTFLPQMNKKTGDRIQQQITPYPTYFEKLLTALASGTGPDIFLLDAPYNAEFFNNFTLPFDSYLKSHKVEMSKWDIPPVRENGWKGKVMGLSVFTAEDIMISLNNELAEPDGMLKGLPTYGTGTFDTWHWTQLVDLLKQGTKVANDGTVIQYGLDFGGVPTNLLRALIADLGGRIFDDDWHYNETKALTDQEPTLTAAQLIVDLVQQKIAPVPQTSGSVATPYTTGKALAAMNWESTSIYPTNLFPQTYIALPFVKSRVHAVGANALCVNKASPNTEAAFAWSTAFCTDPAITESFVQISVPAYNALADVQASPSGANKTVALVNLSRIKGISPVPDDAKDVTLYPRWYGRKAPAFVAQTLTTALQSAMTGSVSVKKAFSQATSAINAQLAQS